MKNNRSKNPAVLIIYYSFSAQTASLVKAMARGLEESGAGVEKIRLAPLRPLRFPLRSIFLTLKMMLTTFLRQRLPIEPPEEIKKAPDLIILAGPTWSYNPSGPVLSFLDRYGRKYLDRRKVMPLISCRGYWRLHAFSLKHQLRRCNAIPLPPLVFTHPSPEPWRTIGVFLKIARRTPEKSAFFKKRYPRYGHSHEQINCAEEYGRVLGRSVQEGVDVESACRRLVDLAGKN